jgi:hypothetical protein
VQSIAKKEVFRIAKEYAEKRFEKDSLEFTDEEEWQV